MGYTVNLDVYSGPMDLLLNLIDQNKIDIYDIPIAAITDKYLNHIQTMNQVDLETMSDFLVMAATLISIKLKMLLPRKKSFTGCDDEEAVNDGDPRTTLVNRLIEYRELKAAAEYLLKKLESELPRVYFRDEPVVDQEIEIKASINQLVKAFKLIVQFSEQPIEADFTLLPDDVDINKKMVEIMDTLRRRPRGMILQELFNSATSRREILGLFLALLELIKQSRVRAVQEDTFGPIKIRMMRRDELAGQE